MAAPKTAPTATTESTESTASTGHLSHVVSRPLAFLLQDGHSRCTLPWTLSAKQADRLHEQRHDWQPVASLKRRAGLPHASASAAGAAAWVSGCRRGADRRAAGEFLRQQGDAHRVRSTLNLNPMFDGV